MAYPAVAAPYGLIPINLIGGQPFAGSTRHFPIASAYATAIFFGDTVKMAAGGTGFLEKDASTTAIAPGGPVGIFLGVSYTDPTFGKVFRQSYPGGIVATDIRAYVADDPDILFKVAVVSGANIATTTRALSVGKNAALVQNVGNPVTGNSAVGVTGFAVAATLPIRIVDVVLETQLTPGAYTEVIAKFNAGGHAYNNPTGL